MSKQAHRDKTIEGSTMMVKCGCGNKYVTLNFDSEGNPFEVFDIMGKAGGCASANSEALARLLSWGLRSGASLDDAIRHLSGIQCNEPVHDGALSCPDAIGSALKFMRDLKAKQLNNQECES